jgi:membrane fusion protein, multidrug efflux system
MSNDSRRNDAHGTVLEPEQTPAVLELGPDNQPSNEDRHSGMPRRKKIMLASTAALLVALAAYFIRNAFLYEDTDDAQVDGHVMPLSARIHGHVLRVNFVEGQLVHANDVLVIIDPEDFQVAVDQAKAALDDAKASAASSHWSVPITSVTVRSSLDSAETAVANAEAALKATEHNYESAKAALVQAEANAVKSDADLERYKQLVAKEDISRQLYDQAVAAATANRAAVTSAQAGVQAAEQGVRQSEGKLVQAKADLRTAQTAPQQVSLTVARANAADAQVQQHQAELAQAQLNFSYTIIRSPVTGIIGKKSV